ncbi:hypothetical protein JZ751_005087, partial [Albula glossodonta]
MVACLSCLRYGCPQETGAKAVGSLFGLSAAAASFFTSLSVKKRSEAEQLWKNAYHHSEVRDQVEDLLQLEAEWDAFLEHLDIHLQTSDVLLSRSPQARSLAGEMVLTDARSGESVNLTKYLGKGESLLLSVRVLVVSFGCQEGALNWLQSTGCKYDMLLDPQKK